MDLPESILIICLYELLFLLLLFLFRNGKFSHFSEETLGKT